MATLLATNGMDKVLSTIVWHHQEQTYNEIAYLKVEDLRPTLSDHCALTEEQVSFSPLRIPSFLLVWNFEN